MKTNRWLPVVGGVLMNLALGSLYAWSVFVLPLEKEFSWTRTDTSWVYTIAVVCFAATFIAAGRLQDRKGPKICAYLGGILVSLGFFLASFTTSLVTLYIFFGVIVGVGNGFGYSTPTPVASKWCPDKRGLVVGLMVGGYGAGQAIFGTFANERLIPALGWRTTFQILSGIFLVMTMIGATLLKNPPAGYKPANWTPKPGAHATHADFTTSQMLSKSNACPRIAVSRPAYIGLRTNWLKPVTTRRSVGAMGIGVPPALTNAMNACTGGMRPPTMSTTPRTTRSSGPDPGISQWVISQGPSPTNVPGAATKKAADPTAAVEVRTA